MKGYTLELGGKSATVAAVLGILVSTNSREREGIKLGISERTSPDFTIRLGKDQNQPEIIDARIVDCVPVYGAQVTDDENAIWLERTSPDQADVNKSLVHVTGFEGYKLVAGSPKPLAAGPNTLLVRMKPNSAMAFLRPDGKTYVMYTNNDARVIRTVELAKFEFNLLTTGIESGEPAGVGSR